MLPSLPVADAKADPSALTPQDKFLAVGDRFRALVASVTSAQAKDRRLSTDRLTLEKDKNEVSAQISENPCADNSALKGRLTDIEKDFRAKAKAAQANLVAKQDARDEATDLRQQFENPAPKQVAPPPPPLSHPVLMPMPGASSRWQASPNFLRSANGQRILPSEPQMIRGSS